jgi:predicted DsbA family dithiol-disulfide isomerase
LIPIPVSITSDFICPWCFIGERRLARAASHLARELADEVHLDITWCPFELNPDFPPEGIERRAYRIAKFGSWENSLRLDARVTEAGKTDGVVFNYGQITRTPNTRRAHRLVWWAARVGHNADALAERLFQGYFVEGLDLAAPSVLAKVAGSVGIDERGATEFLDTDQGTDEIAAAGMDAWRRGIHGVPDFRIGSASLSGAQPIEAMVGALRRTAATVPA